MPKVVSAQCTRMRTFNPCCCSLQLRSKPPLQDEPPAAVSKRKRSLEGDGALGQGGGTSGGALVPASTDVQAATGEHLRAVKRQQTVHPVAARLAAATLSLTATFPPILAVYHPSLFTTGTGGAAASACSASSAAAVRAAPRRRRVQLVAGRRPTSRSASWLRRPPRTPPVAAAANGLSVFGASTITRLPVSLMESAPEFEELDEQFVPAALQPPPQPVVIAPNPAPVLGGLGGVASGGGASGVPGASLLGLGLPTKPAEPAADKAPPSLLEAALGDLKGDTGKASRVRRVASTVTTPASSYVTPSLFLRSPICPCRRSSRKTETFT
jgi:hypothetical protein